MKIKFDSTVSITNEDGTEEEQDVEVEVSANIEAPIKPRIGSCPDNDDPGDPGELEIISITRYDTDEDITDKVDHDQFWEQAIEEVSAEDESAYESALEARADARAEREERDIEDDDSF